MASPGKNCLVTLSGTAAALSTAVWASSDNLVYQAASTTEQGQPLEHDGAYTVSTTSGALSSTAYSLNRLNGSVIFGTTAARNLTVVGNYLPTSEVTGAYGLQFSLSAANNICTPFGNEWQKRIQGLKDVVGSITDYHDNVTIGNRIASTERPLAISLFLSSTSSFFSRFYGFVITDDISAPVDGVVEGSIGLEGTADLDGRLVTFTTRGND